MRKFNRRIGTVKVKHGFTLIEIMLVIGVIGILVSVIVLAVQPKKNIQQSQDILRLHNASQIQSAIYQHEIDKNQLPGDQTKYHEGSTNWVPICAQGVTTNTHCLKLDSLVPDYIGAIPRDPAEPCDDYSGYRIYLISRRVWVEAIHIGKLQGDSGITVTPGCGS